MQVEYGGKVSKKTLEAAKGRMTAIVGLKGTHTHTLSLLSLSLSLTHTHTQVADADAMQRERDSLARMVRTFLARRGQSDAAAAAAAALARETGDIAPIMPFYERAITAPLRNALTGDLVQLLLVQVQRAKSDVAMSLS